MPSVNNQSNDESQNGDTGGNPGMTGAEFAHDIHHVCNLSDYGGSDKKQPESPVFDIRLAFNGFELGLDHKYRPSSYQSFRT